MDFYNREAKFNKAALSDTRAALRLAEAEVARLRADLSRALAVLT